MSFYAKCGTFNTGTGTSDVAVTGLGFNLATAPNPILLFFFNRRTEAVDTVGQQACQLALGFGTGTGAMRAIGTRQVDVTAEKTISNDANCLANVLAAGTVDGLGAIKSLDADGFTIKINDAFAQSYTVFYLALAGTAITGTAIGTITEPAATGNQATSGLGIAPDGVFFLGSNLGTPPATGADSTMMFGVSAHPVGSSTPSDAIWAGGSNDASNPSVSKSYCRTGECVALFDSAIGGTDARASMASLDSDGFTLNWSERAGTTRKIFYLAIKGPAFKVGSFQTLTNTTSDIVNNGFGFTPTAGLLVSSMHTDADAADTPSNNDSCSFGAFAGGAALTQRVTCKIDPNNTASTSVTGTGIHFNDAYVSQVSGGNIDGSMTIRSIDHDGFTGRMTDADPSGVFVWYLAMGEVVDRTAQPPQYPGLRGVGPPVAWGGQPYAGVNVAPTGGGDVTAALTGVSATGSPGTVTPAVDVALTGVSATGSPGTVSPAVDKAISGVGATGAVGSVGVDVTVAISGVQATGAVGSLGPAVDAAVSGNQATGAVGTLGVSVSVSLTGVGAAGQVGSVSAAGDVTAALTGVQADGQVGAVGVDVTVAITGVQAVGAVGSMGVDVDVAISGVEALAAVGTVVASGGVPPALPPILLLDRTGPHASRADGETSATSAGVPSSPTRVTDG